jgi:hypothetical protein
MKHPSGLTARQVADYLHHSYTRVDGLWFVCAEKQFGFDAALALDESVWRVLPKIQARRLREDLRLERNLKGLSCALKAKLTLDRYEFRITQTKGEVVVRLSACPWHELILRSGRGHLAERIGGVICNIELPVFAREFNCTCAGVSESRLCCDGRNCVFRFLPAKKKQA